MDAERGFFAFSKILAQPGAQKTVNQRRFQINDGG
jgi:hypothetical protein